MALAPYRAVLSVPGVLRLLLFGVLARVPQTAAGIVLSLHVVGPLGRGWAAAGLVGTASTVGMAIGSPWRGRAVDTQGLRRALVPSVVASALVWGTAPFVGYRLLLALAIVGGVLSLPIFTVMRQSLAVMVPAGSRRSAMALDSVGVELSFMAGPALGVLLATQLSTSAAILSVGGCIVVSGLALIAFDPPTRSADGVAAEVAAEEQAAAVGLVPAAVPVPARGRLTSPAMLAVLGATAAATVVLAGTDVSVVAHLRADSALALTGLIFAAWGIGSIVGGLVYGTLHRPVSPLLLLLGLGVLSIPVGLAPSPWLLALTMLPAAALCAPVITSTSEAIVRLVPEAVRGEAMGWHGSALQVGSAVGAPLAGVAIDAHGAWAGFAAVGAAGVVLALAGLGILRLRRSRAAALVPA
ncbi:MFS transporter [Kineosporia sp. A_224]|uniref:MFS transporter n=1 Tax=Kineosporia sp. A_224 TaxID=1962180 RepID=UPI000B4B2C16|nr:MFS transporter [Kineosporia sp. A_224]